MEKKLKEISLRLLDLGKRNRLLNYKAQGLRTIEVLNDNFEIVFNKLTNSTQLNVYNIDAFLEKNGKENETCNYSVSLVKEMTKSLLRANDILCYRSGMNINKVFKTILREFKDTLIEKGINTLYFTFGLVEYKEKNETFYAPLLLIPIQLECLTNTYKIKEYDDEIILNPTLAYMIKMNYQIELASFIDKETELMPYLEETSEKLSKIGMKLIINHMSIGIYSFLKMNMFNDLNSNKETILQNQNILQLLGKQVEQVNNKDFNVLPVVLADSSQLEAIEYASGGTSFVLQGPPGSGKSQTITNIIATLIGQNKKVLFVSEKLAALNVVYENLKRAGLESFALELHSNKANKKEFIDELYKTAILPKYDIKNEIHGIEEKYGYLKNKLEEYRRVIHKIIPRLQLSIYNIYAKYLETKPCKVNYQIENIEDLDFNWLLGAKDLLNQYAEVSKTLGANYHESLFSCYICKDKEYAHYHANEQLMNLYNFYKRRVELKDKIIQVLPVKINSLKDLLAEIEVVSKIIQLNFFMPEYFVKAQRRHLSDLVTTYLKDNRYLEKSTIDKFISLDFLKQDVTQFLYDFKYASSKKLKFLSPTYRHLKRQISIYTKIKMKDRDIVKKLEELQAYEKVSLEFANCKKELPDNIKIYELEMINQDLNCISDLAFDLKLDQASYQVMRKQLIEIMQSFNESKLDITMFNHLFDQNEFNLATTDMSFIKEKLRKIIEKIDLLTMHVQRMELLEEIENKNLLAYLDKALKEKVDLTQLSRCLENLFWQANIFMLVKQNPLLNEFTGLGIDSLIAEFKNMDDAHLEANKAIIVSKLSNLRPDDSIMAGSKFSVLVKEYNKNRKQKPIRVLLEEIFDFILDLKPVFLMSPLSVSTYLNSKLNLFDVVIFDEASQVFAWDALGAIYRAKQCIIIGDSKQMPPSNFFNTTLFDEDDEDDELESILDKGSSIFITRRLNFHYRSRSEELIDFSNRKFYNSRLITIPQAKLHKEGFGIDFYHLVSGIYDTKTRTNLVEANYVVDLIFKHFETKPEQSLGVVAFSNSQAELILAILEKRIMQKPEYKKYLDENRFEPFFVKNLESVQGDERDKIIFSICYGYNQEHKFYQHFGPLNVLGGERRLNVAVTRAKYNICVVSSILASNIRLENTSSEGVRLLKAYLDYAEHITTPTMLADKKADGVVSDVATFLIGQGFLVKTNVGFSTFKVDVAVLHPLTKEYVAAIMLDGDSYMIGNCSDTNHLQEVLLQRLGWQFYRLFSTLWVMQEKLEKEKLIAFLNGVMQNEIKQNKKMASIDLLIKNSVQFEESFDKYNKVSDEKILELYHKRSPAQIIHYIVSKEEPIHKDYLLKRICFMYGRTKVTNLVREMFLEDLQKTTIIEEDDFLMLERKQTQVLRIPSERAIEHIHILELEDAIYQVVKKSNGITKDGCYKTIIKLLGYNRMSDNAIEYLEKALTFLKLDGKLVEKNECLYC